VQLLGGVFFSLSIKWQNETSGYGGYKFDHAYFQSFFLSVGKSLALIVYAVKQRINKKKEYLNKKLIISSINHNGRIRS
jgi:hypothetical protein